MHHVPPHNRLWRAGWLAGLGKKRYTRHACAGVFYSFYIQSRNLFVTEKLGNPHFVTSVTYNGEHMYNHEPNFADKTDHLFFTARLVSFHCIAGSDSVPACLQMIGSCGRQPGGRASVLSHAAEPALRAARVPACEAVRLQHPNRCDDIRWSDFMCQRNHRVSVCLDPATAPHSAE